MSDSNLKDMLNPRDVSILDAQSGVSWQPKNPRDLVLPYISDEDIAVDRRSIDFRRAKAKEVYDGYGKIIEECKRLEEEIINRCKNVAVPLNPSRHKRVMDAIQRTFGTNGTQITFDMYRQCVVAMAKTAAANIPKPGGE